LVKIKNACTAWCVWLNLNLTWSQRFYQLPLKDIFGDTAFFAKEKFVPFPGSNLSIKPA